MSLQYEHLFTLGSQTLAALSNTPLSSSLDAHTATPPILCLHGWLDNSASFIPLASCLNQYPLLALEFPGHGHSSHKSADAFYHFLDWVYDLVLLCRQNNWQTLTIIGHSMGGMVATALAASFPELVGKLILIDSLGFVTQPSHTTAEQLRLGIKSRLKQNTKPIYENIEDAAKARLKQSDFSLDEALLLTKRGTKVCDNGVTWRADLRLRQKSIYRLTPEQADNLIEHVKCEVLAILAKDSLFDIKPDVIGKYKTLTSTYVSGGHHCHMTQPNEVATIIHRFLSQ